MRVIQDSDDEFDDDLEADIPPAKRPDAPERQLTNEPSQSGTGSSGTYYHPSFMYSDELKV